jgi:hypothetical protein
VEKLESQNRRWKVATLLLALSSATLVLAAAKPADRIDPNVVRARVVEAQDFILKDEDGQVHARLSLTPDVKAIGRISIYPNPEGPSLRFYDESGRVIWTAPQRMVIPAK